MSLTMIVSTLTDKKPGASVNQDLAGHRGPLYWLMDGATPPGASIDLTLALVRSASSYFEAHANDDTIPLYELISGATRSVLANAPFNPAGYTPNSTLILVRVGGGVFSFAILGDSTLAFIGAHLERIVSDDRLSGVAVPERTLVRNLTRQGASESESRYIEQRGRLIAAEQRTLNTPHGYWMLAPRGNPAAHALYGEQEISACTHVLLCTDGFARAVDKYGLYPSWSACIRHAATNGLETVLDAIRNYESGPATAHSSSRSDDATAILISLPR